MSPYYDCLSNPEMYGYEKECFWIGGILLVFVGIVGFIGTLINFVILCQGELSKDPFYKLLMVLNAFDLIFIVSYGIGVGYQALACQPQNQNVHHLTYPIFNERFWLRNYIDVLMYQRIGTVYFL